MPDYGWIQIVQEFHEKRPGVPMFLLCEEDDDSLKEIKSEDLDDLGIRKSLGRSINFEEMINEIAPLEVGFDVEAAIDKADKTEMGGVQISDGTEFCSIRADNFLSGTKSIFDVYVKLSSEKFIKICQAGLPFDEKRVINYLKKGVTHFYIQKNAQEVYLKYCEHLTMRILKSDKVSIHVKVAQTLNFGDQTMGFIKEMGVSESELNATKSFVSATQDMLGQLNPERNDLLRAFLNDAAGYDHGVSTTMKLSLVSQIVGISCDFSRVLEKMKTDPKLDPLVYMKKNVLDGFSKDIAKAFFSSVGRALV